MSLLQKALAFIDDNNYDSFFELADKKVDLEDNGHKNTLSNLQLEYTRTGNNAHLAGRCKTLARVIFKDTTHPTQARFLTNFYPTHDFIGRTKDLQEVHRLLESKQPTVVVNGIGGIGKTALAKQYVVDYQDHYDHIGWIDQQTSLLEAFTTAPRLVANFQFTNEDEITRFKKIITFLENQPGKNLLVVDNYERIAAEETTHRLLAHFQEIRFQHWHVLFTSRQQVYGFQTHELATLPEAEAIALFKQHCPGKAFEEAHLIEVLKLIDYHTLAIELLAKNYANSWDLDSLAQVIDILENKALDDDLLQELIKIGIDAKDIRLYTHLVTIFDIKPLSQAAIYLLKQFAVLPNEAIAGKQLLTWLHDPAKSYRPALQELAQKGWLSIDDTAHFEMHRLTQLLMQKVLAPTFEDNEALLESIYSALDEDKVKANPLNTQYLLSYAEALLTHLDFNTQPLKKSHLQDRLASTYYYLGMYERAEALYTNALAIDKEVLGDSHPDYATALNNLAGLYGEQGKYAEAEPLYQQALAIRKEALGDSHPSYAESLNDLAFLYYAQGRYAEAEPLYQQALAIKKEALGESHPDYAESLNNLALLYNAQGKYAEAEPLYQQSLAIRKEALGESHPAYARALNNLAGLYDEQGKYTEAEPLYQKALGIWKEALGDSHPDYAITLNNLALLYDNQGKYAEAEPLYQQALAIWKEALGDSHPDYATALNNLAGLYDEQGKYAEAEPLYQQALAIRKEALGELHPAYAESLHNLGALYYGLEDYPKAKELIGQAYAIRLKVLGAAHPSTKSSEEWLEAVRNRLREGND